MVHIMVDKTHNYIRKKEYNKDHESKGNIKGKPINKEKTN